MHRESVDGSAVRRLIEGGGEPAAQIQDRTVEELAYVLSTAAGPLGGDELHGEQQALAAFRAARDEPAAEAREIAGEGVIRRGVRRLGAVRSFVLAVIVAALFGGGVAVAGGGIPLPSSGDDAVPDGELSSAPDRSRTGKSTAPPGEAGSVSPAMRPGAGGPSGQHRSPTVRTIGLCRAYLQRSAHGRMAPLDAPAFEELVAAAGGPDRVDGYCDAAPRNRDAPKGEDAEPSAGTKGEPPRKRDKPRP